MITVDFPETIIADSNLNVGRCKHLIEFMKVSNANVIS